MMLTSKQKGILLHMTGLDRSKEPYRTHFATDEHGSDWDDLQALVVAGLVRPPRPAYVTEAGIREAKAIAAQAYLARELPGFAPPPAPSEEPAQPKQEDDLAWLD